MVGYTRAGSENGIEWVVPVSTFLGQMHTVGLKLRIRKRGDDVDIRDVGLVKDVVEDQHDGIKPPYEPEGNTSLHGRQQQNL
jgi:hypothetical protein